MTTPILGLDEWESGQAQPSVTVNTSIRWLECFAQLSVISMTETSPPETPSDGDRYIVGSGATGDWADHDLEVALYMGTAWQFKEAPPGSVAYVSDEDAQYMYKLAGSTWSWEAL